MPATSDQEARRWERKMEEMKKDYDKIIRDLSKKISELEYKEVNLKMMDSNVPSEVLGESDKAVSRR